VKQNKGFTLIELLIVLAFVGIIAIGAVTMLRRMHVHHQSQMNASSVHSVTDNKVEKPLVHTRGRFGYIPFPEPLKGAPTIYVDTVLKTLEAFEQANPDKKIVQWEVLRTPHPTPHIVYGIWITIESRPNLDSKVERSGG
jgi:prepilin-type N-terminal cleavage/methylation domain-containing protein